ncbi:Uu.00g072090.m01.CDS01 [Anthostomella pinea]|uniref:Uu.00g072090.m01.CDS01 n=1 Tax=Anthostomella pinea TaxID=933095 RepID=A0AAI8YNP8_9PEZI|nr:Uu.00g072090.m01.CDS01 [Anthostomella pinea]
MDVAYKQHANQARRKGRSSTNLHHLSLAPLTSKLPLTDPEDLPDLVGAPLQHNVSYLQGKSAPTTPRLLQSPPRTRGNSPRRRASIPDTSDVQLPKSKSTTHLSVSKTQRHGPGALSPLPRRRPDDHERNDSDWLLRTAALVSSEARESKGQAWLVSRASSTSLTGVRDAEEEAYQRELARERELASLRGSRRGSRRGSTAGADEDVLLPHSRFGSRSHSRVGSRSQLKMPSHTPLRTPLRTPLERLAREGGYFNHHELSLEEHIAGPDFVSLDEKLESIEIDTSQADEATVRRLVSRRSVGMGAWMWSLFSVDENDEDSDNADDDMTDGETDSQLPRTPSTVDFEGFSNLPDERVPPPKDDEGSGWGDAAWLLSVAAKVLV